MTFSCFNSLDSELHSQTWEESLSKHTDVIPLPCWEKEMMLKEEGKVRKFTEVFYWVQINCLIPLNLALFYSIYADFCIIYKGKIPYLILNKL